MICNYIVHHYFLYARTTYTYKINLAAGCSWHLLRIRRPVSIWSAVIRWGLAATSVWGRVRLRGTPNRGAPGEPPNGHFHRGTKMASSSTLDLGYPWGTLYSENPIFYYTLNKCVSIQSNACSCRNKQPQYIVNISVKITINHCHVSPHKVTTWIALDPSTSSTSTLFQSLPSWTSCSFWAKGRMFPFGTCQTRQAGQYCRFGQHNDC